MSRYRFCLIMLLILILALYATGCATTVITRKANLDEKPDGIRVYAPRLYLFVGRDQSLLISLPDNQRAYDIKPHTVLAKQEFTIKLSDSQLAELTLNQDTTGILDFLGKAGELAEKAAVTPVAQQTIATNFGLESGIYRLEDDGNFRKISQNLPSAKEKSEESKAEAK
jgi:hypothetical protein